MTVILICFTHAGDSYAHLAKRCSRPSNLLGGGGGNSSSSQNQARGGHPVANGASFNTSPLGITSLGSSSRTNPHLQPAGASSKLYLNGSRSSWKYWLHVLLVSIVDISWCVTVNKLKIITALVFTKNPYFVRLFSSWMRQLFSYCLLRRFLIC